MAAGKGLHQTHQGVVNGLVAVGVVFAEDVAHYAGALAVRAIGGQPQFVHCKQDPPLHWLEAIAHIRECPAHDHAHGVLEVGALHLLMQRNGLDAGILWSLSLLAWALFGHPVLR